MEAKPLARGAKEWALETSPPSPTGKIGSPSLHPSLSPSTTSPSLHPSPPHSLLLPFPLPSPIPPLSSPSPCLRGEGVGGTRQEGERGSGRTKAKERGHGGTKAKRGCGCPLACTTLPLSSSSPCLFPPHLLPFPLPCPTPPPLLPFPSTSSHETGLWTSSVQ